MPQGPYIVIYEEDPAEIFEHIFDAASAWQAYPSLYECYVTDCNGHEIQPELLESVVGKKTRPCELKPRPRNYTYQHRLT